MNFFGLRKNKEPVLTRVDDALHGLQRSRVAVEVAAADLIEGAHGLQLTVERFMEENAVATGRRRNARKA